MPAGPAAAAVRPLIATELRTALVRPGTLWRDVRVIGQTGSTNEDLLALARNGAPEGTVLIAEAQLAGRGRLGRSWVSLPGDALTFSVLLRPAHVPPSARGWIPLLAGVAVARALRRAAGVAAQLKWPNDVLAGGAKLAGILAEQAAGSIVVGIGINTGGGNADMPVASATSLAQAGAVRTDRHELLVAVLGELDAAYRSWAGPAAGSGHSDLRQEYLAACGTIGQQVRVSLPGGEVLAGTACDIDDSGRLLVKDGTALVAVSAGDVIHVR